MIYCGSAHQEVIKEATSHFLIIVIVCYTLPHSTHDKFTQEFVSTKDLIEKKISFEARFFFVAYLRKILTCM